jgi:hypothetical protein
MLIAELLNGASLSNAFFHCRATQDIMIGYDNPNKQYK